MNSRRSFFKWAGVAGAVSARRRTAENDRRAAQPDEIVGDAVSKPSLLAHFLEETRREYAATEDMIHHSGDHVIGIFAHDARQAETDRRLRHIDINDAIAQLTAQNIVNEEVALNNEKYHVTQGAAVVMAPDGAVRAQLVAELARASGAAGMVGGQMIDLMAAGLSLGEYTALVCAQAMRFDDALTVVRRRGAFMQEAAEGRRTAMGDSNLYKRRAATHDGNVRRATK